MSESGPSLPAGLRAPAAKTGEVIAFRRFREAIAPSALVFGRSIPRASSLFARRPLSFDGSYRQSNDPAHSKKDKNPPAETTGFRRRIPIKPVAAGHLKAICRETDGPSGVFLPVGAWSLCVLLQGRNGGARLYARFS